MNLPAQPIETPAADPAPRPAPPKAPLVAGSPVRGLVPQTIEEAARLASAFVASGMVPESLQVKVRDNKNVEVLDFEATRARCLIVIMKGMEVGLAPVASLSTIYVVNNKPVIYGDGALALIQNSEKYEWHNEEITGADKSDAWTATCSIKRRGVEKPFIRSFSWADAKAAGLTGKAGPWTKYARRQLQMRARSWAMRDGFADVLLGLGIAEEVGDIPPAVIPKADAAAQVDEFTTAALTHQPAATVDFSTLQRSPEPVAVQQDQAQPEAKADHFPGDPAPVSADAPERNDGACLDCRGRGLLEDLAGGKTPCITCKGTGKI